MSKSISSKSQSKYKSFHFESKVQIQVQQKFDWSLQSKSVLEYYKPGIDKMQK